MTTAAETKQRTQATTRALPRLIGWQGFTLQVPENWDLTGFSGTDDAGYLRIDDSANQSLELKWGTESKKYKTPPDVEIRRESYFSTLRKGAKKKNLPLATRDDSAPRGILRDDRDAVGFAWTGDQRAVGTIWHCATCRRTVIAQVNAPRDGRSSLGATADRIWQTLSCHDQDTGARVWSLYDLQTVVPPDWSLVEQQLMNVYLRLTFSKGAARLNVEQWALANIARKEHFLDQWLYANTKGEMIRSRYAVSEGSVRGFEAVEMSGGLALMKMGQPLRELTRLQIPATHYSGVGWQNEAENKIYLVQGFTRKQDTGIVREVAERTGLSAQSVLENVAGMG